MKRSEDGDAAWEALGRTPPTQNPQKEFNQRVWLTELGMPQYIAAFESQDIDASTLLSLTEDDLKEIGVEKMGHRKTIKEAIGD